jgi:hypothetical protein
VVTPSVPDTALPTALKAGQPGHLAHHQALHTAINLLTQIIDNHKHAVGEIIATGTPSASTFLRGDGVWAVPPSGGATAGAAVYDVALFDVATFA